MENIKVEHEKQPFILSEFIREMRDEFKDENWEYLDFIADRVILKHKDKIDNPEIERLKILLERSEKLSNDRQAIIERYEFMHQNM